MLIEKIGLITKFRACILITDGNGQLYYLAEDLETTKSIAATLPSEGIRNWNFHVLAKDEEELYQHHIHQATTYQQLDTIDPLKRPKTQAHVPIVH